MLRKTYAIALLIAACGALASDQLVRIVSITFEGNETVETSRLAAQMRNSRVGGWYQPAILEAELENLAGYYRDQGFLEVRIGPADVTLQDDPGGGKAARIRLPITEGPRYTLREVKVENARLFNPATMLQMSPLGKGDPYSRRRLAEWQGKIADAYQSMGYIRFAASLQESIHEISKEVDCVLTCREGRAYKVGKITVAGLPPADQIRFKRQLLLGEGLVYNPEMIPMSLYYINASRAYRPLSGNDVETKINDAAGTVDLVFHVVPMKKSSSVYELREGRELWSLGFSGAGIGQQERQPTIRTEVALVNVIFSAVDRSKRPVSGMKAEDFQVFEDKRPQRIDYFSELGKGSEIPLTIALLIDTSGSVKDKLEYEKETAAEFFKSILRKSRDLATILQFDSDVNLVQDFTDDPDRLINSLDTLKAGNSTSLYDAVYLAVDEKLKTETGRKICLVITDGEDTSSHYPKDDAIEIAQKNDVIIYGIGVRSNLGTNFGVLNKFAEETGGLFFSPRARLSEIQEAFRAIREDLQGQYSLAYTSTNQKRDGSFRKIEIRTKVSGLRIRARKGYYAPSGVRNPAN